MASQASFNWRPIGLIFDQNLDSFEGGRSVSRLFESFFTTKPEGQGTGLGLATVFGIVKQSGGHVLVSSEAGKGTCFAIVLPELRGPAASHDEEKDCPLQRKRSGTVFLVEDEPQLRRVAKINLEKAGLNVLEACDGLEAIEMLNDFAGRIDVLLTDVVMPRSGGREVADRLRETHPEAKVIYMSGYTDDVVVRQGVSDSQVTFLPKPFSTNELVSTVTGAIEEHQAALQTVEA